MSKDMFQEPVGQSTGFHRISIHTKSAPDLPGSWLPLIYCLITSQWEPVFPQKMLLISEGAGAGGGTGRAAEICTLSKTLLEQISFPSSILSNQSLFN